MKTSVALGAGLLVLAALMVLRNATSDSSHTSNDTLPSIESGQPAKTTRTRRANSGKVVPTPQTPTAGVDILGAIEAKTDPDRSEALDHAAESVSIEELPGLLDSLVWIESSAAAELRELLIRRWAESDGAAAAAWTARSEADPASHETLTQVALGWAGADLSASLDWVRTLLDGESREALTLALGYETARTDAVKALEMAASLGPTRQRDDLIAHAFGQWAMMDSATALPWAKEEVSDLDLRQRLLAAAAVSVAGQDGTAAATLAATALDPGVEQDRVAVAVVQRWVQNEPELAAAWVAQFPDTPARQMAAESLVAFWAAHDGDAAANWLRALPEGTLRTAGMTAYAQVRRPTAPFMAPE